MLGLRVSMEVVRPPSPDEHQTTLKLAASQMLKDHHRDNTDRHFQAGNNARYGYKRRRDKYCWRKLSQTGQNVDLVNSGASRRRCTAGITPIVAAVGAGDKEVVHGHFSLNFDWRKPAGTRKRTRGKKRQVRRPKAPKNVTIADMKKELASWHESEVREAVDRLMRGYMEQVRRDAPKRHVMLGK